MRASTHIVSGCFCGAEIEPGVFHLNRGGSPGSCLDGRMPDDVGPLPPPPPAGTAPTTADLGASVPESDAELTGIRR